jgi:hypothetical protein
MLAMIFFKKFCCRLAELISRNGFEPAENIGQTRPEILQISTFQQKK